MSDPAEATAPAEAIAPLDVSGRLDRLRPLFGTAGPDEEPVDALFVTAPANIRWLSGFTGSSGLLLVTRDRAVLTTDGRYRTQSAEQLAAAGVESDVDVSIGGVQVQRDALAAAAGVAGRVGLEADHVTWSAQRSWDELLDGTEVVPTRGLVERLRSVKSAAEVLRMARAADIADRALGSVLPLLEAVAAGRGGELTEA